MSMTPMMRQYQAIKAEHKDALLMFRLGDFYELFFDDAKIASRILEITLTGRDAGSAGRIPMCGVPYHSAEQYIARLVDHGYSVAICEQTEDPKQAKGLVTREVIRVVTPGTAVRDGEEGHRFLSALLQRQGTYGLAYVDVGTGDVFVDEADKPEAVLQALLQWQPAELLLYEGTGEDWPWLADWRRQTTVPVTVRRPPRGGQMEAIDRVLSQYRVPNLLALGLEDRPVAGEALGFILAYLAETQKTDLRHLRTPRGLRSSRYLVLDHTARRNLELLETVRTRQRKGSLFGLLAKTRTAMGTRLLGHWIERPLCDVAAIEERLDAVDTLVSDPMLRGELQQALDQVYDLERLAAKVSFQTANARDLLALARSLAVLPQVESCLRAQQPAYLRRLAEGLPDLSGLVASIEQSLVPDPPVGVREGGLIRPGVDRELDELRELARGGKEWLAAFEQRERERTGIKSLKVGYNRVFGYYIEVSKANTHLVPDDYERRQTLASAERYVVKELKEQESRILGAEERAVEREYELFVELRQAVWNQLSEVQAAAEALAQVDVLTALATVSAENRYVRPEIREERGIYIRQGRHPTVEALAPGGFVPNDVHLDDERQMVLITGPNMAGKSTYMRQTAQIVILSHIGCFVPAEEARIGLVDRIFTRIGASDDLSAGQSTFMVEMVELAQILRQATPRSLVLLDEIGRGTSTYDGLCIAEAVMEDLRRPESSPLVLFATHYHELTEAAERLPNVVNASVAVHETEDGIRFLHTVVDRPADRSYGIQVARLAGIPEPVISRAQELLRQREAGAATSTEKASVQQTPGAADDSGRPVESPLNVGASAGAASEQSSDESSSDVATVAREVAAAAEPQTDIATDRQAGARSDRTRFISRDGTRQSPGSPAELVDLPLFQSGAQALLDKLCRVNVLEMTPLQALNQLYELVKEAKELVAWDESR
jgi:DNA mismatch repair protein MutS